MSRPPTMSQLLKRAGLAKRPKLDRTTAGSTQQFKRKRPSGAVRADGGRGDGGSEAEAEGAQGTGSSSVAAGGEAVDDQIAALERELQSSGDSSSDEESSGSEDDGSDERPEDDDNGAATTTLERRRRQLKKLVSPLDAEKIEPLPAHLLPRPGCGTQKDDKKKKKKKTGPKAKDVDGTAAAAPAPSRGLDSAVKELLANYEARSSERVPFYCRVCQFQGERCV